MKFDEKIKILMDEKGTKVANIARETGIPASTLYNALKRGSETMDIRHLSKISDFFDVSMDYLAKDEITDRNFGKVSTLPTEILPNMYSKKDSTDVIYLHTLPDEGRQSMWDYFEFLSLKYTNVKDS